MMVIGTFGGEVYTDENEHFLVTRGIKIPVTGEESEGKSSNRSRAEATEKPTDALKSEGGGGVQGIPIMRHGETIENKDNTAHGWSNEPLIPEGRKEVEKTANTLAASNPPTLIAHSDLKRAAESAKIVADKTGAKTLAIPELRTWDIGSFAGKDCGECERELKPYIENPDKRVPGGESFNDFRRRVTEGFGKAMSAGADMIVTHNKTERMIDAMEKSENPHEVFTHNGGPEPGQMRKIQLAGDILPFPMRGQIPMGPRPGSQGRHSIVDFEDQVYFKGERYSPDLSNVKDIESGKQTKSFTPEEVARGHKFDEKDIHEAYEHGLLTYEEYEEYLKLAKPADIIPGPQNWRLFQVKEPGAFGVDSPGYTSQLGKKFLEQHPERYRPMHGEMEWDRYRTGKDLRGSAPTPEKEPLE